VSALYRGRAKHHFSRRVQKSGHWRPTSPQCQPTTVRKDSNLDRIEHTLHMFFTRSQVEITVGIKGSILDYSC
jgi:hypothetical protein